MITTQKNPKKKIQLRGEQLVKQGKVKELSNDDFEILYSIKNDEGKITEVSFIKKNKEFKCFNKYCSNFRSGITTPSCYHTYAVYSFQARLEEDLNCRDLKT